LGNWDPLVQLDLLDQKEIWGMTVKSAI